MTSSVMMLDEIKKQLSLDGVAATSSSDDKLCHIWKLHVDTKANLAAALENIDILRHQYDEETKGFEDYVEHITKLSDERESLAVEYEVQNNELKETIKELTLQLASYHNTETADMLVQQGLDDIAASMPGEQVAFLLVERARLMDELDELQSTHYVQTPEGLCTAQQVYNMLEQERTQYRRTLNEGDSKLKGEQVRIGDKNLQHRNSDETWNKLRDLLEKVEDLETTNDNLMQRVKRLSPSEYDELVREREREREGNDKQTKKSMPSKQVRPWVPPTTLKEACDRLKAIEAELDDKTAELQDITRIQRREDILGGGAEPELERHNSELQRALGSVETQLQLIKNSPHNTTNDRLDESRQPLSIVQSEFEKIKSELVKMMEKYNVQYRKYTAYKLMAKNKIYKAREGFKLDKLKLTDDIERLENELCLVKVTLSKELEYKDNMETSHHNLLVEQRDLLARLSEHEELVQDITRQAATLDVRCQYLDDENTALNQRIEVLTKQKYNLERVIKEYQTERDKVDLYRLISSGPGGSVQRPLASDDVQNTTITFNAINTSYKDGQQILEALLSPRGSPRRTINKLAPSME